MEYLAKLKDIKEAKERISYIQTIKKSMLKFYDFLKDENENINEYKKEMDELYKEKMMHVEELRLIHTDINLMEMVIKQSNEHKTYCLYEAKRLYEEYLESRTILSGLKSSIGIEEEFTEIDDGLFKNTKEQEEFETFLNKSLTLGEDGNYNISKDQLISNASELSYSFQQSQEKNESLKQCGRQQTTNEMDNTYQALADFANNRALSFFGTKHNADPSKPEEEYQESVHGDDTQISPIPKRPCVSKKSSAVVDNNMTRDFGFYNFNQASPSTFGTSHGPLANNYTFEMPVPPFSGSSSAIIHRPSSAIFRNQQPPPMKTCLSCHQQIHRNAPICPLCKAKSRSRNPKKPKKKI